MPIRGKAKVTLCAEKGATIESYVYVVDDKQEQSLLGEQNTIRLGIVKLHPQGAAEAVSLDKPESEAQVSRRISYPKRSESPQNGIVSGGGTQTEIDANMKKLSAKTGKFQGPPIKIQVHPNATPMIQQPQRIPLHYMERLQSEITKMSKDDISLEIEEPGTYISNLVITDKKWDPEKIRVTLDCQQVNKDVYQTHEAHSHE